LKRPKRHERSGNRGGRFGGSKAPKTPISVGEEYNVKIEDVSRQGNAGIAKIEGLVIFVNNASPGERVTVRIVKVENGYAKAEILNQIIKQEDKEQGMDANEIQ
jgi:predicted RNA-binding protein with TRAM domain